ncbi:hypothetical protein [Actinomadura logoneensis]|uniref:hypothetical protein n=1 Tax=Actinomadura logoneensis TaxID=2293572 RepID=UPI001314A166|nr:hypothetical protein [Actinomadura logoneensis]
MRIAPYQTSPAAAPSAITAAGAGSSPRVPLTTSTPASATSAIGIISSCASASRWDASQAVKPAQPTSASTDTTCAPSISSSGSAS